MKELTTEEKTELLCKLMSGMGMSSNDFMEHFEPEPDQPIIKKSGGTWVKREDGIDYLWVGDSYLNQTGEIIFPHYDAVAWKPIIGLEITDEIAKLNPMVKCVNGGEVIGVPEKLIHVVDIQCFVLKAKPINPEHYYSTDWMHLDKCKLATVSDLEQS